MQPCDGQVALVTGASRGIGRAIALKLAEQGANVAVHYRSHGAKAQDVTDRIQKTGRSARAFAARIEQPPAVRRLVREVIGWSGRLDALVTAAGIYRGEATADVGEAAWSSVIRTDLEGTFRTIQAAAPHLARSRFGAVVTISSILASRPSAGGPAYQAAKAGIEHLTRALAYELAPRVRVNCIAPGFIRTDMNRAAHHDAAFSRRVRRSTPLGRWGEPEDVAPAACYLLSPWAESITGVVLGVDGGIGLL